MWGGDVAYTDQLSSIAKEHGTGYNSLDHIIMVYNKTHEYPFYDQMKEQGTRVIGVWDDHDFGVNDGDQTFPYKLQTRDIFLDFVDEPHDSPRRQDKNSSMH
jgi:alkaline phosphatase D